MTAMHFVDTNVLVYQFDESDPAKQQRAIDVMCALWETRSGRLSHQVLQEFYVTVTRKLNPSLTRDRARDEIRDLLAWRPVSPAESLLEDAWHIEDRYRLSWWDSSIVASARTAGCAILLSEDLQDGLDIDGLRVMNPFSATFDINLLFP
jgi:predicted nucleic acid-binding protein